MSTQKLYMLILGCRPAGRAIEQHDIFFGIAECLKDLVPAIKAYWPEAKGQIHIDAWREVKYVNGYEVAVQERQQATQTGEQVKLFFINLGGYKQGEFEEYHYKMLVAAPNKSIAQKKAKDTAFFRHTGITGGEAHIDDKYGIDVDDVYVIEDILASSLKERYSISITTAPAGMEDEQHIGYYRLDKI